MLSWWIVLLLMQSNDFRQFVCKPAFWAGFLFAEVCFGVDAYGAC